MKYQGQVIYQFDIDQNDQMLKEQAQQIIQFSTFIFGFLILGTIILVVSQNINLSLTDLVIYLGLLVILSLFYRRVYQKFKQLEDQELDFSDEKLVIYEYGLELPPLFNTNIDPLDEEYQQVDHLFIAYNEIDTIEILEDVIELQTKHGEFAIDLYYFPFSSQELSIEELEELMIGMITLIKDNLEKVENRDHPTIIPRAYFRGIIS